MSLADFYSDEIQRIGDAIGLKGRFKIDWGTDDIINIAAPEPEPPQTETVEVKRYLHLHDDGSTRYITDNQNIGISSDIIVELTGSYQKPIKPKVKRREEVEIIHGGLKLSDELSKMSLHKVKFFAEWVD